MKFFFVFSNGLKVAVANVNKNLKDRDDYIAINMIIVFVSYVFSTA